MTDIPIIPKNYGINELEEVSDVENDGMDIYNEKFSEDYSCDSDEGSICTPRSESKTVNCEGLSIRKWKKGNAKSVSTLQINTNDDQASNLLSACIKIHSEDADDDSIDVPKRISGKSFQQMRLSNFILRAVLRKGYRVPSPIQRTSIPLILSGRDVVGMARTGSGKTAAFIIPILQMLGSHSLKVGIRAIVLSPTRDLGIQTFKFVKELSALTDLRSCLIVGGDNLEDHFTAITGNPDIVVATPGRLMHLVFEMGLKFDAVEYVVFDEADRLFEMGFAIQINELIARLPEKRQTLLFSATMPESLVEFTKAGLKDPVLVRLDTDFRMSKDLETHFIGTMKETRDSCLLSIIETCINSNELTLIFVPTKHHAEYVSLLLNKMQFNSLCIYGDMEHGLRTSRVNMFRSGKINILVVTDLAARGIDIPLLDNVINYTFPSSSKLFIHRVGRVGRAGRKGVAYSIVSQSELPLVIDLQVFTGRSLVVCPRIAATQENNYDFLSSIVYGVINMEQLTFNTEKINKLIESSPELLATRNTAHNANKMYLKTLLPPSRESIERSHKIHPATVGIHPLFMNLSHRNGELDNEKSNLLECISNFRPSGAVFKILSNNKNIRKDTNSVNMGRVELSRIIEKHKEKSSTQSSVNFTLDPLHRTLKSEILDERCKDYIPLSQKNIALEKGLKVSQVTPFLENSNTAILSILSDNLANGGVRTSQKLKKNIWDSKKRNFRTIEVGADNKKLIRSESGALVPISLKSNRFQNWKNTTKSKIQKVGDIEIKSISEAGVCVMNNLAIKRKGLPRYRGNTSRGANGSKDTSSTGEVKPIQKLVKEKIDKIIKNEKTVSKYKKKRRGSRNTPSSKELNKRGMRNKAGQFRSKLGFKKGKRK